MNFIKSHVLTAMVFLLVAACSSVSVEKSAFDDSNVVKMKSTFVGGPIHISLYSDGSMPKNQSLAILELKGHYKASSSTFISMKVGKEKFTFKPIDLDNQSKISSNTTTIAHKTRTQIHSVEKLELTFYIPDDVLDKISKLRYDKVIERASIMVSLANNVKIEEEMNPVSVRGPFGEFYQQKHPSKQM